MRDQYFIKDHFLLTNVTAVKLYKIAADLPIIDYHCHINPQEIAENHKYENLTQLWLRGDHYKWRLMRAHGVKETYITGDADDYDKFFKYAEVMEKAIGNPVYIWSHMELKKYFHCERILSRETARDIWDHCQKVIAENDITVRSYIAMSNVELICTTDDPVDTLEYHQQLKNDKSFRVKVLPAWRPDKVVNIEKSNYLEYLEQLTERTGMKINTIKDLREALRQRMDFFQALGCCVSDHGLYQVMYTSIPEARLEEIFQKRRAGDRLSEEEILGYKTELMLFFGREYAQRHWVMQLHFGAKRDNNTKMYGQLGPDTGYDAMTGSGELSSLADFLDALEITDQLPKTILYSLNAGDNEVLQTIAGCFPGAGVKGKVQHGSAWWFNDHRAGIQAQLTSYANQGLLGNFLGMLTDSRSFSAYVRHDYFRRIFCDLLGDYVESGQYPAEEKILEAIVKGVCYGNTKEYFRF